MLNKVILMGRLTRDPELKSTPTGASVVSFSLAVERNFARQGEQRQADFINCVAWRNQAEFLAKYFVKGQLLALSGNLQTRQYDDKDGKRVYVTEVVVDELHFAERRADSQGAGLAPGAPVQQTAPRVQQTAPQAAPQPSAADDFVLLPDDDELPF